MSVTCGTITVRKPANITATNITFSTTDCDEPCSITVTVTWTNIGGRAGSFIPNISIDLTPISPAPYPSENLAAGASVTHGFTVSGLMEGDHQICPNPN